MARRPLTKRVILKSYWVYSQNFIKNPRKKIKILKYNPFWPRFTSLFCKNSLTDLCFTRFNNSDCQYRRPSAKVSGLDSFVLRSEIPQLSETKNKNTGNLYKNLVYLKLDDKGSMASSFCPSKLRLYSEVDFEGRMSAKNTWNLELITSKV